MQPGGVVRVDISRGRGNGFNPVAAWASVTHEIPWFSALSAGTELLVTAALLYVLHQAIFRDRFEAAILGGALAYEVLFNISYMVSQLFTHGEPGHHPGWMVALLAGHGILSLIMFLALVGFSAAAYRAHRQGRNLFADHLAWTGVFVVLWMVSILSGEAIFVLEYVMHV